MPDTSKDLRKKILGRAGERAVAEYLEERGLKILKRNYVTPFGEADVVAEDVSRGETAFIEVKTRTGDTYGTPAEAVAEKKRARYRKIASYYWLQTGKEPNARFDVAEVYADGRIEYIEYAF